MEPEEDRLFLTFSAEEIGMVAVMIIKGIERSEAIKSMPRYTKEQHSVYSAFYEQFKEALDRAWKGE